MKNKEKYAKEIIEIVCENGAVNEQTGELKSCSEIKCKDCLLRNGNKSCILHRTPKHRDNSV